MNKIISFEEINHQKKNAAFEQEFQKLYAIMNTPHQIKSNKQSNRVMTHRNKMSDEGSVKNKAVEIAIKSEYEHLTAYELKLLEILILIYNEKLVFELDFEVKEKSIQPVIDTFAREFSSDLYLDMSQFAFISLSTLDAVTKFQSPKFNKFKRSVELFFKITLKKLKLNDEELVKLDRLGRYCKII